MTLNLLGGKFYKAGGDKSGQSIWDRRGKTGSAGGLKKSRLSNIKTTFFTPIGTQSGYRRSKAQARKYCQEEEQVIYVYVKIEYCLFVGLNEQTLVDYLTCDSTVHLKALRLSPCHINST